MIDTEALRKKVIDLAIQGKLTQQLPEDGNADDLYAQIQEEKAKLINEGKIKKEKPLPEISDDEIPFEIPTNWKWVRFGETTIIERGGSPRPIKNYITDSEDGINWIKIGDVEKGGKYIYSTKEKIVAEGEKKSRRVYPGDFLLTNSMSFGRPYISQIEGCIHDGWLLIRDLKGFSADYLYYLLSSSYMYGQFCNKASGATVENLNIDKVNTAMIPLPPMAEQKRIAEVIAKVDDLIKSIDTLQQQYESDREVLKGKIIDAGIHGKLTVQLPEDGNADNLYAQIQEEKAKLIKEGKIKKEKALPEISEDEIPFEIPDNWKWVRLRDICSKIVDGDHNPPAGVKKKTDYLMLSAQNINNDKIVNVDNARYLSKETFIEEHKRTRLEIGDVLLTIVATLGRSCVYRENYNVCFQRSVCVMTTLINPDFLKRVFDSSYIQKLIKDNATGAAQPGFYLNKVEKMLIPLPPLEEQKRIVKNINGLLNALDVKR